MSLRDIGRVKCHKENRIDNHCILKVRRECGSCTVKQIYSDYEVQMEHSYSRDSRPLEGANGLTTRTLMVHRPPQCPSCHSHPMDEGVELDEGNHPPIPSYNEQTAKESMNECLRIANSVRNLNSEEQDWEEHVNKIGWSQAQEKLFSKVARILDLDHLARLATNGKQHEPVQRRVIIDKSVQRIRQALASVSWDSRLTQWLHVLLMENLPPSYIAIYLDILQTLKTKLPTLMDKMLFGKPMNINQDLLTPVMKKQWDPVIAQKTRKLPASATIVVIPSTVSNIISSRMQKWYQLLATIAPISQINIPGGGNALSKQPIDQVAEQLISISRVKIQDLRSEQPNRQIILVGFNAGAALALQIALAENVNSVVCLGFAFNTINGIRGEPDDHILEITTPIMFVIGQNSSRTSQEEMESLREKLQSETSLVVVGSADDVLRVPKNKRQIEGITQSMVDNMITDEVYEFIQNCIANPPGPRIPTYNIGSATNNNLSQVRRIGSGAVNAAVAAARKRKLSQSSDSDATQNKTKCLQNRGVLKPPKKPKFHDPFQVKRKVGRPRTRPIHQITAPAKQALLSQPSTEVLNMAIQSILPDTEKPASNLKRDDSEEEGQIVSTYEIITQPNSKSHNVTQSTAGTSSVVIPINPQRNTATATSIQKVKMVPQGQYLQLKSAPQTSQQKIFTIKTSPMISNSNQTSSSSDTIRSNQGQVFTVKTTPPSQYIQSSILNSQKFTVIKPGTSIISATSDNTVKNITTTDLSSANIFDIPIVFADNDGNLHDTAPITSTVPISTSSSQIILTQPQNQDQTVTNKGYVFNSTVHKNKPNKVVFINRNTMKPCSSIISKAVPPLKYTKVVVTNPKTSTPSLVSRAPGPSDPNKTMTTITIQKPKTMELAPGTVVKTTTFPGQSGASILNTVAASGNKQYQPIIINVDSDKTTIKNMIKVGDHQQIKPTILLKPGGVKQIPVLKPGILNRNLTVRKVVNLIPGKAGTPTTLHQISTPVTGTITTSANQTMDTD